VCRRGKRVPRPARGHYVSLTGRVSHAERVALLLLLLLLLPAILLAIELVRRPRPKRNGTMVVCGLACPSPQTLHRSSLMIDRSLLHSSDLFSDSKTKTTDHGHGDGTIVQYHRQASNSPPLLTNRFHYPCQPSSSNINMTIVYALVSRQRTVLAEHTATSGEFRVSICT